MRDEQKTKAQLLSELQAVRQSEELYRQLFEGANDAIVTFTLEGAVTRVNRGLEVMLGWSREELIGQHYRKFVTPASVALGEERTRRFLAGDRLSSIFEAEMMRKDGKVVPVEVRTRPILDTDGKPVGMQGIYRDITVRKQQTEELRRSEQFKTLLITQCPLGVVTYAPNGDVTMVNKAFMEMWGVSWEQVRSYNLFADSQLLDTPLWTALKRLTEKGGVTHSFELQYDMDRLVPGRGKKWISAKYYAVQNDDGKVISLVCFNEDITGRKQAEEALRERELRLRTVVSSVPVILWAIDRNGVFTFAEGKGLDPLRGAYGDIVGRSVSEVFHNTPQLVENTRRALVGEGLLPTIEVGELTFEIHPTVLHGRHGELEGVIGVSIDVTERRRMEESLRESEERYRNLFENANDAIAIVDLNRTVVSINRAMEQLLGWSREELIGQRDHKVLTPAGIALSEERERRIQNGERVPSIFEHEFVRKDGGKVLVEGRTRFIIDKVGKPTGFQGIYRDITARKQAEEEREKLQEQLFQARKLEALGTLAGGVAHDFNNILSAIMGFTELAADEVTQGTVAHNNLQEVLKASRRAKALVQQILTFSQPLGRQQAEPMQLPPIIEEVLTFLRGSLSQTIEIQRHLDEAAGAVAIPPSQLRQVLTNLCHNAVQALGDKGGLLEVSLWQIKVGNDLIQLHNNLHPGPHLQLTVRDTGCGMSPEVQDRIFEPFFTTRPVGEGNGLGLAIVHGIVSGHGGAITVDSALGKGTTFQVYLPVTERPRRAATTSQAAVPAARALIEEKREVGHGTHLGH